MSVLTKVLIVLLAFSSFLLCASVVTYVANADNYKELNKNLTTKLQAAEKQEENAKKELDERKKKFERSEDESEKEIALLESNITELSDKLKNLEREKTILEQKVNSWVTVTANFSETTDKQRQLLEKTSAELNKVKQEQVEERKELDDVTASLIEKTAIIDDLEIQQKRLLEEKSELQEKLDRLLRPSGRAVTAAVPVTPIKDKVRPAEPVVKKIGLKGLISRVDLQNSMAEISIGAADGVKQGMVFHVSRGNEFVCDILISDVDSEKAVGFLELMQHEPKVGDKASTNI